MEYSFIKGGKVIERIVCDKKFADEHAKRLGATHTTAASAQEGFEKSGSNWVDRRGSKLPEPPPIEIDLTEAEKVKLIAFYQTNGIITAARAAELNK